MWRRPFIIVKPPRLILFKVQRTLLPPSSTAVSVGFLFIFGQTVNIRISTVVSIQDNISKVLASLSYPELHCTISNLVLLSRKSSTHGCGPDRLYWLNLHKYKNSLWCKLVKCNIEPTKDPNKFFRLQPQQFRLTTAAHGVQWDADLLLRCNMMLS